MIDATKTIRKLRVGRAAALLLALTLLCSGGPTRAVADDASAAFIGTFDNPVHVAVAPGEPRLLFVVEQSGRIQVLRDEQPLAHPFLDIHTLVQFSGESGLLSVAFAPDYETSGLFYVFFNNTDGDIEINEFKRKEGSNTRADRSSRRVLLIIPHPGATNHNGGQLQFGPTDGWLYISTGDGATGGETSRTLNNLLGKILRIDPRPTVNKPYRIPSSNPYAGGGGRKEIYAYGLRNPWRFSFDGKRIIIGDVGEGSREEINFLNTKDASGVNFGWPQYEGDLLVDNDRPGPDPATPPMFVYSHDDGCAVIGGYVARDPNLPALIGRYVYGDLCSGDIRSFIPHLSTQHAQNDRPTGIVLGGLSSFGQGFNGVLYAAQTGGNVYRLAPPAP